jgi:hypothetical protein
MDTAIYKMVTQQPPIYATVLITEAVGNNPEKGCIFLHFK